jgi:hypothetical protein
MREVREIMNAATKPLEEAIPDDFSSYYYESLSRAGEEVTPGYDPSDPMADMEMLGDDEDYTWTPPELVTDDFQEDGADPDDAAVAEAPSNGAGAPRRVVRVVRPRER